jgi:hypothetical protein
VIESESKLTFKWAVCSVSKGWTIVVVVME